MNTATSTASGRLSCKTGQMGKPVAAGEVATLSGLDRKVVDKVFAELKKEGAIVSPVRCKWTPAQ